MLTLAAADTIAADADVGSQVTLTLVGGLQLTGTTTEDYSVLYQGQVAAAAATVYTVPGGKTAFIRSITAVNTDTAAMHSFQLFRGGTAASNQITPPIWLPPGGMATYEDGFGWKVYNSSGAVLNNAFGASDVAGAVYANVSSHDATVSPG